LIVIPFAPLPESAAHEEEFFSRVCIHPRIEHPEAREFLPKIALHFVEQRAFAVDDFIVTEDEDEVFVKCVDEREGDIALMKTAMDRILLHVAEEVVHPTHVPFETEPETAEVGRSGNTWPRRRFFGNGDDAGKPLVTDFVEAFEEMDCL